MRNASFVLSFTKLVWERVQEIRDDGNVGRSTLVGLLYETTKVDGRNMSKGFVDNDRSQNRDVLVLVIISSRPKELQDQKRH